jgi:hypothetical protein
MSKKSTFLLFIVMISACDQHSTHQRIQPATVKKPAGSHLAQITLTPEAEKRLGIEVTSPLKTSVGKAVIPTSSLIYDTSGKSWVFIRVDPHQYHREQIRIVRTQKNQIEIENKLPESTSIVTQGAAELYGTESGVGK